MAKERWYTDAPFRRSADAETNFRQIEDMSPAVIEITDSGAADSLLTIVHGLSRIPRKVNVINARIATSSDVSWHVLADDPAWTDKVICIRVRPANANLLLEIS